MKRTIEVPTAVQVSVDAIVLAACVTVVCSWFGWTWTEYAMRPALVLFAVMGVAGIFATPRVRERRWWHWIRVWMTLITAFQLIALEHWTVGVILLLGWLFGLAKQLAADELENGDDDGERS